MTLIIDVLLGLEFSVCQQATLAVLAPVKMMMRLSQVSDLSFCS